jgi:hypothetical protein
MSPSRSRMSEKQWILKRLGVAEEYVNEFTFVEI